MHKQKQEVSVLLDKRALAPQIGIFSTLTFVGIDHWWEVCFSLGNPTPTQTMKMRGLPGS